MEQVSKLPVISEFRNVEKKTKLFQSNPIDEKY